MLIETPESFDELIWRPIKELAVKGSVFVAIDSETTRIDPKRGFNPFYGVRVSMGSVSWDEGYTERDFAWCQRMRRAERV